MWNIEPPFWIENDQNTKQYGEKELPDGIYRAREARSN